MATLVVDERNWSDRSDRSSGLASTALSHARSGSTRLGWIDAIRGLLAVLVVAHHAGQPYGGGAEWPVMEATRSNVLGGFFAVNAAFFMGLFFLIAAAFFPMSYDRKGARAFLRDRLLRLGGPILVVGVGVFGFIAFLDYRDSGGLRSFWSFWARDYVGQWHVELNHLWFLAHLLVYAGAYALWRWFRPRRSPAIATASWMPGHGAILVYTLALAAVSYVVRIWYPIDRWEQVLGIIPAELAHLPQYLSLFILGLIAARHDWLRRFPAATGMVWLGIGLGAAALRYTHTLWPWGQPPRVIAQGGADWRSLVWSTWEAIICVGLCIGLLILARERFAQPNLVLRMLAANSYGIYIWHVFVLVGVQTALVDISIPPLAKCAIVLLLGIPLSVAAAALIRLPGSIRRGRAFPSVRRGGRACPERLLRMRMGLPRRVNIESTRTTTS